MAVDPRSVTWCAECDWNVDPLADKTPPTKRAVRRQRRADRAAQSQFDRLVQSPVDRPYRGPVWFAALALATSVHLLTLAIAIGGVLAVVSLPLLSKLLVGVPAFAVTWLLYPRLGRMPARVLRRTDAPALYRLLDQVAEAVGTGAPHAVEVDGEFNAAFGRVGLRRRKVVTIGLPLWETLSPQQRVAMLGHELGHDVNGDMRSALLLGTALQALEHWHDSLVPDEGPVESLGQILARGMLHVLAGATRGTHAVLARLSFNDSQRAEYLADDLSARVAGTAAATQSLDAVLLAETVDFAIERAARSREPALWDTVRAVVASIPESERERRRRAAARRNLRIDVTHPPTHLRIAFTQARGPHEPAVMLSDDASAAIDRELANAAAEVAQELGRGFPR